MTRHLLFSHVHLTDPLNCIGMDSWPPMHKLPNTTTIGHQLLNCQLLHTHHKKIYYFWGLHMHTFFFLYHCSLWTKLYFVEKSVGCSNLSFSFRFSLSLESSPAFPNQQPIQGFQFPSYPAIKDNLVQKVPY